MSAILLKRHSYVLGLIIFIAIAFTATSCGKKETAKPQALFMIAGIEGTKDCSVFRHKQNKWIKLSAEKPNVFLYQGDKVKTGLGTEVFLRLPNGGSSLLKEKTEFEVSHLERSKEGASLVNVIMKIIRGTGLFSVKKAPPAFSVSTNHAVTGVLGTKFSVSCDGKKTGISVIKGDVSVTPKGSKKVACKLSTGQSCSVDDDGKVEGPRPPKISELSKLVDDFARLQGITTRPGWNR